MVPRPGTTRLRRAQKNDHTVAVIPAAETELATPAPMDGTLQLQKFPCLQHQQCSRPSCRCLRRKPHLLGVKPDIKDMTLDEKFACLKQCVAYGHGLRKVLCEVFEGIRAEFKTR